MQKKILLPILLLCSCIVPAQEKNPFILEDVYFFNKQIFFTAKLNDKVITSYFYLNTKKGYSLLDKDFFYKADPQSKIDAHLTFPRYKEYFMYFINPGSNSKLSRISHASIPLGPAFLEDPEELLRHFKDWFSGPAADVEFLGEGHNLKSEIYTASYDASDISIYLSRNTGTEVMDNYSTGWLGLGYLNLNGDFTTIITRLMSVSSHYQIDLLQEKDVNFTFDGKPYQPVQARMNELTNKAEEELTRDKEVKEAQIARTDDVTEKTLIRNLELAKEKKIKAASGKMDKIAGKQGKVDDFYKTYNESFADPSDDLDIMEAEFELKAFRVQKKIAREKNAKKLEALQQELKGYLKGKQTTAKYKTLFREKKNTYGNNQKKLMEENNKLYKEMILELTTQ